MWDDGRNVKRNCRGFIRGTTRHLLGDNEENHTHKKKAVGSVSKEIRTEYLLKKKIQNPYCLNQLHGFLGYISSCWNYDSVTLGCFVVISA
jgi:hypothetical protein